MIGPPKSGEAHQGVSNHRRTRSHLAVRMSDTQNSLILGPIYHPDFLPELFEDSCKRSKIPTKYHRVAIDIDPRTELSVKSFHVRSSVSTLLTSIFERI